MYHEISKILNIKKDIILYLGKKFSWYATKMEHLEILDANLKERILHAKLVNQDFALQMQQFFLKKIGRKVTRFLATGDDEAAKEVDGKDFERYVKAVELLDRLATEKTQLHRNPSVGLNLGDGVTVKKVGDNEVEITPRARTAAEMLKDLANMKRDPEPKKDIYDIITEESETNNDEDEGNE
jgi:antitoxin component of MazEF toxin-antitoxin module